MSLYILDTDILSLAEHGDVQVLHNFHVYRSDDIAISIITIEEQ